MSKARIFYARTDEFWRKGEKYAFLEEKQHVGGVEWQELQPDAKHNWLTEGMREDFESFLPIGTKEGKQEKGDKAKVIFNLYSRGVSTSRDEWIYDFNHGELERKVSSFIENYNFEVARFSQTKKGTRVDNFVNNDPSFLKWTDRLKEALKQGKNLEFTPESITKALYRPFTERFLYFDSLLIHRRYQQQHIFPIVETEKENLAVCVSDKGYRSQYSTLVVNKLPELHLCASTDTFQCFPFYTYNEDATHRRENITDWALEKFRARYGDRSLTKWDIFHYVYAVLHHPVYRERYAVNLKRELPRIPFAPDFHAFARAGARLAALHVGYERQPEYPLEKIEAEGVPVSWRVEKMRLSRDRQSIVYNEFLTLAGLPPDVFEYRLGNRSALEWVIDQYQVTTDKRSGITNDPNREDDPEYIVRLVGQVVTVSLETIAIVRALPELGIEQDAG